MHRHRARIAALVPILTVLACGPSSDASETLDVPESAPIATAPAEGPLADPFVSAEWLVDRLGEPELVILEVGTERDGYLAGHLPGARFLAFSELVVEVDGIPNELPPTGQLESVFESLGVSDESRVVIYGAPLRAARALLALTAIGFGERAAILEGDAATLAAAGTELVTGEPSPIEPGDLTPVPVSELVVDADWIAARLDAPGVVFLDARPADQYSGETPGDGVDRPGHIPGALNLWWEEMTTATDPLDLLPEDELRALFAEAGIQPGDTVVTYCRTGVQASMAWAVAELLGYETRIYDASWLDWNRRIDLPVEGS